MANGKAQEGKAQAEVIESAGAGKAATGDNGGAQKAQGSKPAPKRAKPEPKQELPMAGGSDLGAYPLTYHKPSVTLPGGEVVRCPHHWGHEQPKVAQACLRKLAAEAGVRLA